MRVSEPRRLPVPPAKITPFTISSSTLHDWFGALGARNVPDRARKRYPIHWNARREDPPNEADDDDRVSDRQKQGRHWWRPRRVLPVLDLAVVTDRVATKILREGEDVRDSDDGPDREHEPSGRELSTTFGRCEGDCGQDRDSEGERQRVATLPEVTAGIL